MFKVVEVTKDNEGEYLEQIATLEEVVLETMEKQGRVRTTIYNRKWRYIRLYTLRRK